MKRRLSTLTGRSLVMLALATVVAVVCRTTGTPGGSGDDVGQLGLSMQLPVTLGAWRGEAAEPSRAELEILPEDTEFSKMNYLSGAGPERRGVHCSIVLSGEDRTSLHRPEVCLVGQGWNIDATGERGILLRNGVDLAVRRLELSREVEGKNQRALYYYWFVSGEATTPDHLERILLAAQDNILSNLNPRWACVSVLAGVSADEPPADGFAIDDTAALLEDFVARITPEFQTCFARKRWFTLAGSSPSN